MFKSALLQLAVFCVVLGTAVCSTNLPYHEEELVVHDVEAVKIDYVKKTSPYFKLVDDRSFEGMVLRDSYVHVVQFYDPFDQESADNYERFNELARLGQGYFEFNVVNVMDSPKAVEANVVMDYKLPALMLFHNKNDEKGTIVNNWLLHTPKKIMEFLQTAFAKKPRSFANNKEEGVYLK